jgi:bacterioferritin
MLDADIMGKNHFLGDIHALRENASHFLRQPFNDVSEGERREISVQLLQSVLTAEIVCVLRYTMISVSKYGLKYKWIGTEFQEQANDERKHMVMVAERIQQLNGVPNFSPEVLTSQVASINDYADSLAECMRDDLDAEHCIIAHYHELVEYYSTREPETATMLKSILRDEENHAADLEDMLASYAAQQPG